MIYASANKNGKKDFVFPIYWEMMGKLKVQADSLEEAMKWVEEHEEEIELDPDADYIDGTFEVEEDEEVIKNYTKLFSKRK